MFHFKDMIIRGRVQKMTPQSTPNQKKGVSQKKSPIVHETYFHFQIHWQNHNEGVGTKKLSKSYSLFDGMENFFVRLDFSELSWEK